MSIVFQANPLTESRRLENGSEISNNTTFRHLNNMGWTPEKLDAAIPTQAPNELYIQKLAPLCDLYGYTIYLDNHGRFQFYIEMPEVDETVIVLDDLCEHGFVVRDIQGENRFLCRECDERFPRHPDMMDQDMFRPEEAEIFDSLAQFRDGLITFSEATKATGLSLEAFKETIAKIFPPDTETIEHFQLGQVACESIVISEGPKRTSCPADIEALFGNPEITLADIEIVVNSDGVFADITTVQHTNLPELQQTLVEIVFVDGSTQRVMMDLATLRFEGKKMLRQFIGRHHIMESKGGYPILPFQFQTLKAMPKAELIGGNNGNRT